MIGDKYVCYNSSGDRKLQGKRKKETEKQYPQSREKEAGLIEKLINFSFFAVVNIKNRAPHSFVFFLLSYLNRRKNKK